MRCITLAPSILFILSLIPMFVVCPVTFDLQDAEWHDDLEDAREDALDWSVELSGENVIVYEAIEGNYGYDFKPIKSIFA